MNAMLSHIGSVPHLHGHDSTFIIATVVALVIASALVAITIRKK